MLNSEEFLQKFGLKDRQIEIYLSLLKSGPASILNLSNRLNLNRTTVHMVVSDLLKIGIVIEIREKNKRKIKALTPESFSNLVDSELMVLTQKKRMLPELIESVYKDTAFIKETSQAQVKYYNTVESIDWLYDKILANSEVRSCVNATEIVKIFPNNWERFLNSVKNGTKLWDLHLYTSQNYDKYKKLHESYPNFNMKHLPPSVTFESMDYLIYDGKISIIYGFPNPHAIEIENEAYFKMSKELFNFIWASIPEQW